MPHTRNSFLEDLIAICNRHGQTDFIEILEKIYNQYYSTENHSTENP